MFADYYNTRIVDLFSRYPTNFFFNRAPMIYDKLVHCDILFVGVNPSFLDTGKSHKFILSHCEKAKTTSSLSEIGFDVYKKLFYNLEDVRTHVKVLGLIHRVFKDNYPYFSKFNYISEQLNATVEHLDIFPVRETDQKLVRELVLANKDFADACYDIFIDTLQKIKPKAIIVENSFVRDMLMDAPHSGIREYFPRFEFHTFKSSSIGTPINEHGMAVFYTSMLTGQRAIDLGSFHRIIWSLNRLLNPEAL